MAIHQHTGSRLLKSRFRKIIGLAALGAVLGAPAIAQGPGEPVDVMVAPVESVTFVDRVEALGTLQANEMVEITALVTERIEAIHFDDGDKVEAGQLLIEFASSEEKAMLAEANATREEAMDELRRSEQLSASGAASETELGLRRREYGVADARARAVRAQIADREIRAPFSGAMGIRTVSVGAAVAPGDIITRLADTSVMKLDFSVPSTFLAELAPGARIEARTRAYGDAVFRGRVASIDSVVDPVTRSVLVRALIPKADGRLRPGLLMTVDLLFNKRRTLAVDEKAVIPDGEDNFVFVSARGEDGAAVAERRRVQIGARRVGEVEIVSGLSAGDEVITDGAMKLRSGQAISIRSNIKADRGGAVGAPVGFGGN